MAAPKLITFCHLLILGWSFLPKPLDRTFFIFHQPTKKVLDKNCSVLVVYDNQ